MFLRAQPPQKFDSRPLVLHTLPHHPPGKVTNDLKSTTLVIPRLISIVEIIKREYIKALHEKHSPRLVGLHQYNQLGTLENLGYEDNDETPENRAKQIAFALEGQNQYVFSPIFFQARTQRPQHQTQANAFSSRHSLLRESTRA